MTKGLLVIGLLGFGWFFPVPGRCEGIAVVMTETVGRTLAVSKTEVTQAVYQRVTGNNPSVFQGDELPVDSVSWYDAVEFCNLLSLENGLEPAYGGSVADRSKSGWRLPTEEEWMALAETSGPSDPAAISWYINSSERLTHPVGSLAPNALGLFDLFGNVWEWCDSELAGGLRADHGGGYRSSAALLTPSARGVQGPGSRADDLGFRVVRTVKPAGP